MTIIVSAGKTYSVKSGITDTGIQVDSAGTLYILAGGTADTTTVISGGTEYIAGTQNGASLAGSATIQAGGIASNTTLENGGSLTVSSGGRAIGTSFDNFAVIEVEEGGAISDTKIVSSNGGQIFVNSGGKANGTTVGLYGDININPDAVATDTKVTSGGFAYVAGTEKGGAVYSGGVMSVSHGKVSGTTISSGGVVSVTSKGTTDKVTIASGGLELVFSGATASDTKVKSGGYVILAGGSATATKVASGGHVVSTGVALVSPGGGVTLFSKTADQSFGSGAAEYVLSGGVESGTMASGGLLNVFKGGLASDTDLSGASMQVFAGGKSVSATFTGSEVEFFDEGTASATVLDVQYMTMYVISGGKSFGTIISAGQEQVQLGSVASNSIIRGGSQNLLRTGSSFGTIISTGNQFVQGTATSTTIEAGGTQTMFGGVTSDTVIKGGTANINSGGITYATTIKSGVENVSTQSVASNTVISAGTLNIAVGGQLAGTVAFAGASGSLVFSATTLPTNTISGFAKGDVIQLAGIAYVSGAMVAVKTANQVQIKTGGKTYTLNIAGATVGETDFEFTSGSLLTKGPPPAMTFLRPTPAAGTAANLWVPISVMRPPAPFHPPNALAAATASGGINYGAIPQIVASTTHPGAVSLHPHP